MKRNIFILVFAILSSLIFAQKAVIQMTDGSTKKGLINGKIDKEAKKIKIKNADSKNETIPIDLIKIITFQDSSGESYEMDKIQVYTNEKRTKSESHFMIKILEGYYDLFLWADISFNKKGIIQFSDMQYNVAESPAVYYYIKKEKEKTGDFLAAENITGNSAFPPFHKYLKKNMEKWMSDDQNLMLKVENKKLSVKDVPQIVREYNDFKKVTEGGMN